MKYPDQDSRSAALYQRATAVMPGGNTRTSLWWPPYSIYATDGNGPRVRDVDCVERLDFNNAFSTLVHGHRYSPIVQALQQQSERLICLGLATELEIELAELLCGRVKSFEHIRFCNSGTEATMNALKAAQGFTNRSGYAKCEGCYHGSYDPLGISTASNPENWGEANRPSSVPQSRGMAQTAIEEAVILPFNNVDAARVILREHGHRLAAIFVDLIPVRMGLIPVSADYIRMLREEASRCGALLVLDEVVTLRFDTRGAQALFDVEPDLTTIGKFIGGGLPIGAVVGKEEFMSVFDPSGAGPVVWQGGTFNANPLTMAAGIAAVLALDEQCIAQLNALGDSARAGITDLFARHGLSWQVTGYGSMFRVHAHARAIRGYREFFPDAAERHNVATLMERLLDRGILMIRMGVGALSSPMVEADITLLIEALDDAIIELKSDGALSASSVS